MLLQIIIINDDNGVCVCVCVCVCVLSGDVGAGQESSRQRPRRMLSRDSSPETFLCDAPGQQLYKQTVDK